MKTLYTLWILVLSFHTFSQSSIGAVTNSRLEIRIRQHYILEENQTIYYGVGFDYVIDKTNIFIEALHLNKNFSNVVWSSIYGSYGVTKSTEVLQGKAVLNYIALRLGVRKVLEGEKISFLYGASLQGDFVYSHREYDKTSKLTIYNNNGSEIIYSDAPDYDAIIADRFVASLSAHAALRIPIKEILFVEFGLNGGFMSSPRLEPDYSNGRIGTSQAYGGVELKLAYTF